MDIQNAAETGMLRSALETQTLGASLITSTIDRLNSGRVGMTPVIDSDYLTQKTILSAAYSERGVGVNLDIRV
jgi:hypothetical protein